MSGSFKSNLRAGALIVSFVGSLAAAQAHVQSHAESLTPIPDGHYIGGGTLRGIDQTWLKVDVNVSADLNRDRLTVRAQVSKFLISLAPPSTRHFQIVPTSKPLHFALIDLDQSAQSARDARQIGTLQCFVNKGCIVDISMNGGSLVAREKIVLGHGDLAGEIGIGWGQETYQGQRTHFQGELTRF